MTHSISISNALDCPIAKTTWTTFDYEDQDAAALHSERRHEMEVSNMTIQDHSERVKYWKTQVSEACSKFKKAPSQANFTALENASAQLIFETEQLREAKFQARRAAK